VAREVPGSTGRRASSAFDQSWYPGDAESKVTFVDEAGRTTLTLTVRYESKAARDGVLQSPMEQGVAAGFDALEKLLSKAA